MKKIENKNICSEEANVYISWANTKIVYNWGTK